MRTYRMFTWAVLPFVAACSSVDVHTDYDASVNFSSFKTYFWSKTPTTTNPLMASRIVAEIDGQLYDRGWRKVPEAQADAIIAAHVTSQEREQINTMYNNVGPGGWYGPGFAGGWAGSGVSTSTVSYFTVGTLLVDILDAKTKKGIWHGTAEGTISDDPEQNQKQIAEAATKLFQNFPPRIAAGKP
jgi:hypothetical protein